MPDARYLLREEVYAGLAEAVGIAVGTETPGFLLPSART
jgi:hypothetical protein